MINGTLLHLALRARMLGLTVATTGSTSLSATSTGYARASGSFLTDNFAVGMELTTVTGFSVTGNNQAATAQGRIVTAVTASAIACSGCATDSASSGRVITAGPPFQRAYENVAFDGPAEFPYIEEEFVPATNKVQSFPVISAYTEDTGLYIVKWFGLSGKGPEAIRRGADAVLARFTGGTALTLSDGTTVRIPTEFGPRAGQITRVDGGWSYCAIEIPYVAESLNVIAA